MNLDKLSNDEVLTLINEIKKCLSAIQLQLPLIGKYKKELQLKGDNSQVEYVFHAYRGRIENKYSLHLRFKENNIHLVRLCINGSRHHNSDGTILNEIIFIFIDLMVKT